MNPADYKSERQRRGTLKGVAALLGKHWTTIARRESGEITFDREMWLALCSLPLRKPKRSRNGPTEKALSREGAADDDDETTHSYEQTKHAAPVR